MKGYEETMLKKILTILLAFTMLSGCGKKKESDKDLPSSSPEASQPAVTDNSNPEGNNKNGKDKNREDDSTPKPLATADIKTGKTDPKRTPSIPETPDPSKVVKNSGKTAGSGSRADEVSEEAIKATNADNAVKLAMQYMKQNNIYIPQKVELDREEDDSYIIHAYEVMKDSGGEHTSSVGWFKVSKSTSEVTRVDEDIKVGQPPESYKQ